MPLNRNPLYRQRKVELTFVEFDPNNPKKIVSIEGFELTEVNSIEVDTTSDVAVATGVVAPVIQGWYFKPFEINITGQSYIGAYADNVINIGVDTDINKILKIKDRINELFQNSSEVRNFKIILKYGDLAVGQDKSLTQRFEGFISDISITENDERPYIRTYKIKYIGDSRDKIDIMIGTQAAQNDTIEFDKSSITVTTMA